MMIICSFSKEYMASNREIFNVLPVSSVHFKSLNINFQLKFAFFNFREVRYVNVFFRCKNELRTDLVFFLKQNSAKRYLKKKKLAKLSDRF